MSFTDFSHQHQEASLVRGNFVVLALSPLNPKSVLASQFFGTIVDWDSDGRKVFDFSQKTVFLAGDMATMDMTTLQTTLQDASRVFVLRQVSKNIPADIPWPIVSEGRAPLDVHGVGVFFRCFFEQDKQEQSHFACIQKEHKFQHLTESNKPGVAYRTGAYLTNVTEHYSGTSQDEQDNAKYKFHMLRCSSNFQGPTLNFGPHDRFLVGAVNREAKALFDHPAELNHVLGQIYNNQAANAEAGVKKDIKAKIKDHSDKTKDMPRNGVMVFCTFYNSMEGLRPMKHDPFDFGRKTVGGGSALTELVFHLKECVKQKNGGGDGHHYKTKFSLKLAPDSAFFMPLSTNRIYTHEIRPAQLPVEQLPTRLGYVVRCSNMEAIATRNEPTMIQEKATGEWVPLERPTSVGMEELRKMYAQENRTADFIDYGDKFIFSMNKGDYLVPEYCPQDEFPTYNVPVKGNIYQELYESVDWESVGKGRQGAVLVEPDRDRSVPIVRTTTQYQNPAQVFSPLHSKLARQIEHVASLPFPLNNALIEHYTLQYAKMGMHSDQALDLRHGSHVAVFSCYKSPGHWNRKLVVEPKAGDGVKGFEVPLLHNTIVVFSLDTNQRFRHKIVLAETDCQEAAENEWLGVTFRTSDHFIKYREQKDGTVDALLEDGKALSLADPQEKGRFYQLRGRENKEVDFHYPTDMTFTISKSDTVPPREKT